MADKIVLNKDQQEALNLLLNLTPASQLQDRERKLVSTLLADCMLDAELNAAVRAHLRATPLAVEQHVDIYNVAFHARQWEKFNEVYTQFSADFAKINKDEKPTNPQTFRDVLKNYAAIRNAACLLKDFDRMHEKGLVSNHPELLELHEKIKKCAEMTNVLEKKFAAAQPAKNGLFARDERAALFGYYQSLTTTFNADNKPDQRYRPK